MKHRRILLRSPSRKEIRTPLDSNNDKDDEKMEEKKDATLREKIDRAKSILGEKDDDADDQ